MDTARAREQAEREFLDKTPHSAEFVYILTTKYHAGIVKIGRTRNRPQERREELNNQTGIPDDQWQVAYAIGTRDSRRVESFLHRKFASRDLGGEVFEIPFGDVVLAIRECDAVSTEVVPEFRTRL